MPSPKPAYINNPTRICCHSRGILTSYFLPGNGGLISSDDMSRPLVLFPTMRRRWFTKKRIDTHAIIAYIIQYSVDFSFTRVHARTNPPARSSNKRTHIRTHARTHAHTHAHIVYTRHVEVMATELHKYVI